MSVAKLSGVDPKKLAQTMIDEVAMIDCGYKIIKEIKKIEKEKNII